MLQKNALWGLGRCRRSRHPPVESDFLFYGGRYGPVVVRMPRILRGVSEGPYGAWGAPPLETSCCRIGFSILWGPAVVRMRRIL